MNAHAYVIRSTHTYMLHRDCFSVLPGLPFDSDVTVVEKETVAIIENSSQIQFMLKLLRKSMIKQIGHYYKHVYMKQCEDTEQASRDLTLHKFFCMHNII